MKTTNELNEKWWYRLLKVFFIGGVLTAITTWSGVGIYISGPEYNSTSPFIECDNGEKIVGSYRKPITTNISAEEDQTYKNFCADLLLEGADQISKNYSYNDGSVSRNWILTIVRPILFTIIIIAVAEFVRRLFYYVLLGSFRPPKN